MFTGQLSWRPDSSGIVGVGWQNHPFPSGCPGKNVVITSLGLIDKCARILLYKDNKY